MPINTEQPWLPAAIDETFDPLEHADVIPDADTPLVVTPRGGAQQVGRSCYQVDTAHATYLVDCGLNQGSGEQFPDLRGLGPEDIDAVFLTHAHIDHCGGLPVLEARGLLDDDASIVATPPTIDLAKLLLEDSLKIHQLETTSRDQQFTGRDVQAIFERFEPVNYGGGLVAGVADVPEHESLVFRFGNAAHLLGSAWLSLQTSGYTAVFSGDLGGRAAHLPTIETPPQADLLFCESTYGATHSHQSVKNAQTTLFEAVEQAIREGAPVLIPTFAVGRAQILQLLFADRLHTLPEELRQKVRLVVDGMAQEATELYHEYVRDTTFMDEAMANRVIESGHEAPFRPAVAEFPATDADRRAILEESGATGTVPIVIAPSGMLTGGNSPRYLTEFAARFDRAKLLLTGYQAKNTIGRTLQNQVKANEEELTYTTETSPFGTDWPAAENVVWTTVETDDGPNRVTRATIPAEWLQTIHGFSAHASQDRLLEYARHVGPETIVLIHGPDYAQTQLAEHFARNVENVEQVTRSRLLTPIPVTRNAEVATPVLSPERVEGSSTDVRKQIEHLREVVGTLSEEVAKARNETGYSESEIREIVRDELETNS
ncbi:ribonuclease BN [Halalkalicoccus paucihalophilus]|uniref:Ribonuclease BN n=1 Tax=Halalkalicoccus paucihalophilus TaxID=1008153 RepID=A0A151AB98_9EURY|nr:MBL fold metallo-hydrolase [Halalkalicoccus paucihalophilus]KYH24830.1 ribonuclease BN [Halalkalicoccus paucihalophilus]